MITILGIVQRIKTLSLIKTSGKKAIKAFKIAI
jgi:hypothetical protein